MHLKSIGLMSGTSMDGIDAALIETDGKYSIKQLATYSYQYQPEFHILLKTAEYSVRKNKGNLQLSEQNYLQDTADYLQNSSLKMKELSNYLYHSDQPVKLADIIKHSSLLHAELVHKLLTRENLLSSEIDLIGYHGQALYHRPDEGFTIQVGDAQLLADHLGILVINDFRSNDIKNGGQGAPLAPIYHQALAVRDQIYPLAVLNCGGIANISIIYGKEEQDLSGFDTGPGNILIDQYIRTKTNNQELIDRDGKYGLLGKVNDQLLLKLQKEAIKKNGKNYLNMIPPKSLDPGDCQLIEDLYHLSIEDGCATLEAFTALTIIDATKFLEAEIPKKWVLAGGGWYNPVITAKLKEYLTKMLDFKVEVVTADQIGWDSQYLEAALFAYLAVRSLHGLHISYPATTRASSPTLGGQANVPIRKTITEKAKQLLANHLAVTDSD